MARESTQQKLSRVRPPRVQITYDVEIGDAIELKELPFVAGVLADMSGNPATPLPPLKERKFVEINPDNFDSVLANMGPRLSYPVKNVLSDNPEAGQLAVDLRFGEMNDFSPEQVARQVEPLRNLLELRTKLSDLRGSLQGNDKLDEALFEAVTNSELREKLLSEVKASGER
jgi:type VI secretion system protein ImpB